MSRRVVVTGLGVVAPNGIGVPAFEHALREGRSGVRAVAKLRELGFGCQVAGLPDSVVSCVSSAAVSTSLIDVSRLAGTSLPNVTFAIPDASVRFSVESVSFAAGGTWSRLRVARNPSSSTVRLLADPTRLGTESAATATVSVEDEVSPSWSVIV